MLLWDTYFGKCDIFPVHPPILAGRTSFFPAKYFCIIIGIIEPGQTGDLCYRAVCRSQIFYAFFDPVLCDKIKECDLHVFFK